MHHHSSSELRAEVGGVEIFWRSAAVADGGSPIVYVHGVPSNADDWLPFLERTGGVAVDLPGFGRSGKPNDFPYGIEGYAGFLDGWLAHLGVDTYRLVVHDWGGVGLALAQLAPERVESLVLMNCAPFLPGYKWHTLARIWRTPLLGELAMGFSFKRLMRRELDKALTGDVPDTLIDPIWDHFDHGTQRAILKLYRSAPPDVLAAAGERLGTLVAPALIAWGAADPYIDARRFAPAYAEALGGPARVELFEDAGHWPWLDRPDVVDLVADHLLSA